MSIFKATTSYIDDVCYICRKHIKVNENIVFLGGIDLAHASCIRKVIEK